MLEAHYLLVCRSFTSDSNRGAERKCQGLISTFSFLKALVERIYQIRTQAELHPVLPAVLYRDLVECDAFADRFEAPEYSPDMVKLLTRLADSPVSELVSGLSLIYSRVQSSFTKKRSGSFYTPMALADQLVRSVVNELEDFASEDGALTGYKFFDPACGPGVFLVSLHDQLKQRFSDSSPLSCIYGVDLDPVSVFLARTVLFFIDPEYGAGAVSKQVLRADSLKGTDYVGDFDVVLGNPPWEIKKIDSRQFFVLYDSDFYRYGKQEALKTSERILLENPDARREWKRLNEQLIEDTSFYKQRFKLQGRGDANLYKYFVEAGMDMLKPGGLISYLVPAGIYCDRGTSALRQFLLEKCEWISLTGYENHDRLFDIHRSFKYCSFLARKGGTTSSIDVEFYRSNSEGNGLRESKVPYDRDSLKLFSPGSGILLELESDKTRGFLEQIYSGSQYLGDAMFGEHRLSYRREFDMTLDSTKFESRDSLEKQGFRSDTRGNWLAGAWKPRSEFGGFEDLVVSGDGKACLSAGEIQSLYLPLYEGRMIGQFNSAKKRWLRGRGRSAVWESVESESWPGFIEPQYLVSLADFVDSRAIRGLKTGFLAVGSDTNSRTMIASCLYEVPCGNAVPVFYLERSGSGQEPGQIRPKNESRKAELQLVLTAIFNSYLFDFVVRRRMAGTNLNYFILEECPLPRLGPASTAPERLVARLAAGLNFTSSRFESIFNFLPAGEFGPILDPAKRNLARAAIDVLVLKLYGLETDALSLLLAGAYLPESRKGISRDFALPRLDGAILHEVNAVADLVLNSPEFISQICDRPSISGFESRALNPKAFFRIDRGKSFWERQSSLTLLMGRIMEVSGFDRFALFVQEQILSQAFVPPKSLIPLERLLSEDRCLKQGSSS